jgi:AraC-like DNA-binding protein
MTRARAARQGGTVSVVLLRPLAMALLDRGIDPAALEDFYGAADVTAEMLADTDARVSPAQLCVAWATAMRVTGDPFLALAIAESMPPGAFGVVEYICRASATVREALSQWCRYLRLLDDAVRVGVVTEGATSFLRVVEDSEAPAPASHELCFALVLLRARAMTHPPLRVRAIAFAHEPTEATKAASRYDAFFGVKVRWGAPYTEMAFDEDALDAPLTTKDEHLLTVLRRAADEALERAPVTAPLTDQVRRALRSTLESDEGQLETVAKRLGMTPRSLQRRLKDEGTAFAAVREDVRKALADRYLDQGLSFAEISFLLGFSEPSAFFRAFKRWTGLTPYERRSALTT